MQRATRIGWICLREIYLPWQGHAVGIDRITRKVGRVLAR